MASIKGIWELKSPKKEDQVVIAKTMSENPYKYAILISELLEYTDEEKCMKAWTKGEKSRYVWINIAGFVDKSDAINFKNQVLEEYIK